MISHFIGLTMVGSMRPYFRKHVLNTLEPHDFLFINAFFIALLIGIYFVYTYFFENHVVKKTYKNCCKLNNTQIFSLIIISVFTVFSSFLIIDLDKNYNTPFLNYIVIKALSMIALFLVGIFFFSETYSYTQTIGIILTMSGIFILFSEPMKD
uniref:EamA domain-containing protein n=1 Tax=viral metagenome TaxID=1070528 RepID=A0A6C0JN15_9ZZZZ